MSYTGKRIEKAQDMKDILIDIPEENFITDDWGLEDKCCSLGHINKAICGQSMIPLQLKNELSINSSLDGFGTAAVVSNYSKKMGLNINLAGVNDGIDGIYFDSTPKARVMHLIEDMIKEGF